MNRRNPLSKPKPWDYGYLISKALLRDLRAIIPLEGRIWLDIGCGNQPYRFLYDRPGRVICGLDIESALSNLSVRGSADHLPVATSSCDVVLLLACLLCVDDPVGAFQEAARVLRKGGRLVVSDTQTWHTYSTADRYHFTANGLRHLGHAAGFVPLTIRPQGSFWARTGIRLNRAILPYSSSPKARLAPLLAPLLLFNNLVFGFMDRLWKMDGEVVNHLAVYEKP